jgi:twinkle protein
MFGQRKFKKGGKILIITAGEEDAVAAYRMTEFKSPGKRGYPSVSLPNGAGSKKAIQNNLEWIESFEKVVFAVDQEALDLDKARTYCEMLSPGKGHIANFSENDASDMCTEKKFTEFYKAIWSARSFQPSGIIEGADVWTEYRKKDNYTTTALPSEWDMTFNYGLYSPSLVVITAGTGVGKSTILKHLQYHLFRETTHGIGIISMEEPMHLCAGILMGLHIKKRINLPDVKVSVEEEKKACNELFDSGRFVFCENTGIRTPDDLFSKIRFMAKARDCKFIFLDHLTAIVNKFGGVSGSKNDYTESIVNTLNDLCQELSVCIVLVSHVRKTGNDSDTTYETGKVPSEDSIFGSSSIKQYSYTTLAISRDKSAEDTPMFIHVLKDRLSGRTGKSCALFYDQETGWLKRSLK